MASKTATRSDLYNAIHASCASLTRGEARTILEATLEEICVVLALGETVKLSGFGTFSVRPKTARVGRNPRNGKSYPIDARYVLRFRPSRRMRSVVGHPPILQAKSAIRPQHGAVLMENSTTGA